LTFQWLIPNIIGGMGCPGQLRTFSEDIADLEVAGVRAVVCLLEDLPEHASCYPSVWRHLHLPICDFNSPSLGQVRAFLEFVETCKADGRGVAVHCWAGLGRTGTMLAAYLISKGERAEKAVRRVRAYRPGSIETEDQEVFLEDFALKVWPY